MKKFLLIRLSSLGDIILTTPVIRALKTRYPDCQVDFVVYDRFAASLQSHPDLGQLFLLPKKKLKEHLKRREYSQFWLLLKSFIKELRNQEYDYIIDLHNVTDSALVAILARGVIKAGHRKQLLSMLFNVRSSFDVGFASAEMHAAETNLAFLVDAGCLTNEDLPKPPHLEFHIPSETVTQVDDYLKNQGLDNQPLIGINPCASYDFKRWNAERFAAVADFLHEKYGYTVLIFGSPAEQPVVQSVISSMKHPAIDTTHLTALQAFGLIGRLRLLVTNDSAPMHIAAALGTPVVVLHGPINIKKFAPLSDKARSISKPLPCLPCKDIATCPTRDCFNLVTVEEVCQACDELLFSGGC